MKKTSTSSRRQFLYNFGMAGMSIHLLGLSSNTDQMTDTFNTPKKEGKLGIALVGLGGYATGQLGPALLQTEHCYLAGIVTGSPDKIPAWKEKYQIPDKNIYSYDNYDSIKNNPDIDIIYVVLPNNMHAEYSIRAFQAGKHVICEKPLAITVEDCDRMIAAAKTANRLFSVGYRLHFEPFNKEMMRLGTQKVYGNLKKVKGGFGFKASAGQWRLSKEYAGGGPLMDVGIYAVQGMCYTTGLEPIAVTAIEGQKTDPERFKDVEQSLSWKFEFPGGIIGEGEATYDGSMNYLTAIAEKGEFELKPAYNYGGQKGTTPEGPMNFPSVNQQAKQMDAFALAIKNKTRSIVPAEMGKRDVKYLQAIYEAMRTGKRVSIK
jgi:predicted dehydrogenase